MKICVAIPCLMLGGSEVATLQMVQALVEDGHRVTVVCYYGSDPVMVERYRKSGCAIVFLEEKRGGLGGLMRLTWRLVRLFHSEKPDAVHVQYFAPGMVPIIAARLAGIRHVFATVHAAGGNGYDWKAKLMFRISAAITSHFICVAENTEKFWFGSVGGRRHSTIHNGIDVRLFADAEPAEIPGLTGKPVIGIVGRIVKLKGHDCLFRAVKRLLPEFPDLQVLIVGCGPAEAEFRELADSLGIADHLLWCGRVEPEDLPGYYKRMDVLAMPSHWEGFGLTAAEAMAAGVPVVVSDVPGLREVVGDAGLLFPVNDDVKLAQAVRESLHRGKNSIGMSRVQQKFSSVCQFEKWKNAYRDFRFEK